MIATQALASVRGPLVQETVRHAIAFSTGPAGGSVAVRTLAEGVMRSFKARALKVWLFVGLLAMTLAGGGLMLAGNPGDKKDEPSKPTTDAKPDAPMVGTAWRETYTAEFQTSLPVSVAFSADGNTLFTGDTNGEVMALKLSEETPTYRWKSKAEGSHARWPTRPIAAHLRHDQGWRSHPRRGHRGDVARTDAPDSNPIAIGVFPNKIDAKFPQLTIASSETPAVTRQVLGRLGKPADTLVL